MLRSSVSKFKMKRERQRLNFNWQRNFSVVVTCRTLSQWTHYNCQFGQRYRSIFILIEEHKNLLEFCVARRMKGRREKEKDVCLFVTVMIREMSFRNWNVDNKTKLRRRGMLIGFVGSGNSDITSRSFRFFLAPKSTKIIFCFKINFTLRDIRFLLFHETFAGSLLSKWHFNWYESFESSLIVNKLGCQTELDCSLKFECQIFS